MKKIKSYLPYLISFILILILFDVNYGLNTVLPSNTNWIMSVYQDWGQHYLGWAYFREEPWTFPLGQIDNYNYPAGSNVGYTDSIPLAAFFFKLFSFILPETFQYLGFWLLICHLLTGFYTIKIVQLYNKSVIILAVSALLIAFNPVLLYRGMHPALCSHWMILASLYYYLIKENKDNFKSLLKKQFILVILAALINPYILFIVIGFGFIISFKYYFYSKIISLKQLLLYTVGLIISVLVLWFLTGLISFKNDVNMEVANSYGLYSFNLNSFYNPENFSKILPLQLKVSIQQYEGFAYLGVGILSLILGTAIVQIKNIKSFDYKKASTFLPLVFLVLFFTLFAITNQVSLNEKILMNFPLPEMIIKLGGTFRASGRFIWVLYYIIILFAFITLIKSSISANVKGLLFFIVFFIQIYDIMPMLESRNLPKGGYENAKINEKDWVLITSNFKRIITYTPFNNHLLYTSDYQDLCFMALKNKLPITTGYVARESSDINRVFLDSLNLKLNEGLILDKDLYVTTPANLDFFNPLIYKNKVRIRYLDGYYILYSTGTHLKNTTAPSLKEKAKIDSIYNKVQKDLKLTEIQKPILKTDIINSNIDKRLFNNNVLQLQGWSFLKKNYSNNDSIYIALIGDKKNYILKTKIIKRPDLVDHFKDKLVENAGFSVNCFTQSMEYGQYELAVGIKNNLGILQFQSLNQPVLEIKKDVAPTIRKSLPKGNLKLIYNVEKINLSATNYYIDGWAALENQDSNGNTISLILQSTKYIYQIQTDLILRKDVTLHFSDKTAKNFDSAGFSSVVKLNSVKGGTYDLGILITDKNKAEHFINAKKKIVIK